MNLQEAMERGKQLVSGNPGGVPPGMTSESVQQTAADMMSAMMNAPTIIEVLCGHVRRGKEEVHNLRQMINSLQQGSAHFQSELEMANKALSVLREYAEKKDPEWFKKNFTVPEGAEKGGHCVHHKEPPVRKVEEAKKP
jgi:hypothetical protein